MHFCQEIIDSGNVENMSWWKNVPFIYWSKICPSKKRPAASLTTCVIILRRRRYFHLLGKILKPCTRNLVSAKIVNVRQCHSCLHFSTFSKCHSHPSVAGRIDARLSKTHANIQKVLLPWQEVTYFVQAVRGGWGSNQVPPNDGQFHLCFHRWSSLAMKTSNHSIDGKNFSTFHFRHTCKGFSLICKPSCASNRNHAYTSRVLAKRKLNFKGLP